MKKLLVIASVVALAGGGVGFALGVTTAAQADHESAQPIATAPAPAIAPTTPATPARATSPAPETAPSPAPMRTTAPARSDDDARPELRVRRLVVTSGIEGHEPADTIGTMSVGEHDRVYAFVDLANRGDAAGSVVVTFEREGATPTGQVELEVPARTGRWRTWAFTRGVTRAGEWRAVVRDHEGRVLAEQSFLVE